MFDIVALGELLIDFTESGLSPSGMRLFEQNAGGAPCNLSLIHIQMCIRDRLACIKEDDILQGKIVSGGSYLKKVISKLN